MKNYDSTRQRLRELGWRRNDRTVNGIHEECWWNPGRLFPSSYQAACRAAGIKSVPTPQLQDPRPPYRRKKTVQAKHVGDTRKILEFIIGHCKKTGHLWTTYYDLQEGYPGWDEFPDKVRRAKMRKLVAKGFLDGCLCGCRGDLEPQRAAYDFLAQDRSREDIKPGLKMSMDGRALRDWWWEGTTMCVQYHDTGAIDKFIGVKLMEQSISEPRADGTATLTGTLRPEPLEFIEITFVIGDEKK